MRFQVSSDKEGDTAYTGDARFKIHENGVLEVTSDQGEKIIHGPGRWSRIKVEAEDPRGSVQV